MVETYALRNKGTTPKVGIESNAFQRALLFPVRQEMKRSGVYFSVQELKASRAATKQLRILSLQPYFSNGAIHVRRSQQELLHEYRLFPLAKHDDVLDALAYVVQMARPAHEPKKVQVHDSPLSFNSILNSLPAYRARKLPSPWRWHNVGGSVHVN